MKPTCENCGKSLPNESDEAMICTFECTFCKDCVDKVLMNVCPNCGGGFEKRPTRPSSLLTKYPVSRKKYQKPIDMEEFRLTLAKYKNIEPNKR
ncbi:DUF1272 domain-containing protein [Rapidithrix thailandica]|uniref:DUF1272 domain-containing protein n=1 Tax=Rapidithrix thailandica TaxID=413964 RepID=UPI003D278733